MRRGFLGARQAVPGGDELMQELDRELAAVAYGPERPDDPVNVPVDRDRGAPGQDFAAGPDWASRLIDVKG